MPRYTLKSVTEADRQYANLPEATRRRADRRIQELLDNPTGNPNVQYDQQFDQWSIPIDDDKGWIVYAIVENARLVILLRFLPGLDEEHDIEFPVHYSSGRQRSVNPSADAFQGSNP